MAWLLPVLGWAGAVAAQTANKGPQPEPVLRLTIEYKDGDYHLVSAVRLEMVIPAAVRERSAATDEAAGYAYELLDDTRAPVLRGRMDDPLQVTSETVDQQQPERIRRVALRLTQTTFTLLVPAPPRARWMRLTGPPSDSQAQGPGRAAPVELGLFELHY